MSVAAPTKLVEAFATGAPTCPQSAPVAGGRTFPFPVASQVAAGFPGNASLNDGFTPANMTPLNQSGLPMSGPDLQGILFIISSTAAAVSAGQLRNPFDATYAGLIGGYAQGAEVQDATNLLQRWTSAIAANSTDPATTPANWISSTPLLSASAPAAGTHADNVLAGPSDFILDISTAAGAITLNGFVAQRDGQKLVISNTGASLLTIGNLAGTVGNQLRASSVTTLVQNDSVTIQFVKAIGASGAWVVV